MGIKETVAPFLAVALLLFTVAYLAVLLGEERERRVWAEKPSTLSFYATEEVCQHKESGNVLNCGNCGFCSNLHDIHVYHEKRSTLSKIMEGCAHKSWFLGADPFRCLKEGSDMTDGCVGCWIRNYECSIAHCLRTCIKHRYFSYLPSLGVWGSSGLEPCYACDEKICGPAFVGCAGANRRRVGVVSDIERDMEREFCNKTDWDWILSASPRSATCANVGAE